MSPSTRGNDGRDDPTAGGDDPQVKYIAPMPSPRSRPQPDQDSTAAYAAAASARPEPTSYVRPASEQPAAPEPQPAPVVAQPRSSDKAKGGWLAPLAVILVSLAALAAVYFVTQGGDDTRQAAPTNVPSPVVSSPQETPSQESSPTPSSPSPESTPPATSTPAPQTTTPPPATSEPAPRTTAPPRPTKKKPASLPAGVKVCGPKIGAGATTTCGFAKNVAVAVRQSATSKGAFTVGAWSPTTKKDYRLSCTAAPVTVCTGGRAAVIYVAR